VRHHSRQWVIITNSAEIVRCIGYYQPFKPKTSLCEIFALDAVSSTALTTLVPYPTTASGLRWIITCKSPHTSSQDTYTSQFPHKTRCTLSIWDSNSSTTSLCVELQLRDIIPLLGILEGNVSVLFPHTLHITFVHVQSWEAPGIPIMSIYTLHFYYKSSCFSIYMTCLSSGRRILGSRW
jgi:hypothetical protein